MLVHLVAVFDSATQAYMRPFHCQAVGQAMRSFLDEVNNASKESDLSRHPDDFALFKIGEFDDSSGLISSVGPVLLCRAKDLKSSPQG
jgi:hypothetical protein